MNTKSLSIVYIPCGGITRDWDPDTAGTWPSVRMIRSSEGFTLTRKMASFHTLGRIVENVRSLGRLLSDSVSAVIGPGCGGAASDDFAPESSDRRNATSACSYTPSVKKNGEEAACISHQLIPHLHCLCDFRQDVPRLGMREVNMVRLVDHKMLQRL